jgi:hypothetical protein
MTDLTKITTPFGLLDAQTQQALRDHHYVGGGTVEIFHNGWTEIHDPSFSSSATYRAKPKPLEFWVNQYNWGFGRLYPTKAEAEKKADPERIRCIRLIEAPDQSEGADLKEPQLDAVQQDITMGR